MEEDRAPVFWPQMKNEVFQYVKQSDLCQRAKLAENMNVGLHSATPASCPLERVFIDFMGPLVRTKKGNQAILIVMDSFFKICGFLSCAQHNLCCSL